VQDAYIDCLLLHSSLGSVDETLAGWKLLESYVPHKIRKIGISNISFTTLIALWERSKIKPSVVQNRFYSYNGYHPNLRAFCREHCIVYQSYWTLTGNPNLLRSLPVAILSELAKVSKPLALYALVMSLGIAPLNGTTSVQRMREDLVDIERVRNWSFVRREDWKQVMMDFKRLVGDEPLLLPKE
jgi:diketogulonate reductase-like aldo/keto reductase